MMGEGWAHLHRDLRAEMGRDALIVDVRGNRGGHTSQLIVEKLARRILGWKIPRHLRPYSYPQEARRGPLVALADEFAGSDGDIVTAAIKSLGLGPVIGARTWGGVVGIDGSGHGLVDGTRITIPRYASWFNEFGWSVENYGVDPDTEVLITPDDWAAGHDPQLEVAVDRALALLEENPRPAPTRPPARPSAAPPPPDQSRPSASKRRSGLGRRPLRCGVRRQAQTRPGEQVLPCLRSSATEVTPRNCMVDWNCRDNRSSARSTPASPPAISPYR